MYHVSRMNVLDRLKQLIHDVHLVDVLQDVALLNDVVKIGFWGNGPKRVSGQMSENRRGTWPVVKFFFEPGKTHPCTRISDICPDRCSPCEDRSVVWCSRDWRMIIGTLSRETSSARPFGYQRRRRSSSSQPSPCFSCRSPSKRYRKPTKQISCVWVCVCARAFL